MRLVEKSCPNCGANLEFDEDAKSCKCQYCKRSFEIERDMNDIDKFNLIYDKIQKPFKVAFLIPFVFAFIIFIIIFCMIFFGFRSHSKIVKESSIGIVDKEKEKEEEEKLLTSVDDLNNSDFDSIDNHATTEINRTGEGVNNADHSYSTDGKITREKLYIAYKEGSNYVVPIYKVTYRDFFHQEDRHTVFVPILFENIEKNVIFSIGNAQMKAPKYCFNSDCSSYTSGYVSLEEAYNEVVKPYEEEYTISEK